MHNKLITFWEMVQTPAPHLWGREWVRVGYMREWQLARDVDVVALIKPTINIL